MCIKIFFSFVLIYFFVSIAMLHAQIDASILSSIVAIEKDQITLTNPYIDTDDYDSFFSFSRTQFNKKNSLFSTIGTGIIIKKELNTYYIISNNHVVEDANDLWITLYDGTLIKGKFHSANQENDIAIIQFKSNKEFSVATLQAKNSLQIGEKVYAIGNPYGFPFTITEGIISGFDRSTDTIQGLFIQTDAALNPGNSGGAIVNKKGEIVGISTWIFSTFNAQQLNLNFAIDIHSITHMIPQLIAKKTIDYSWLGITVQLANPSMLYDFNIKNRNAVIISNIFSKNKHALNTLKIGDAIIAVDNQSLKTLFNDNYSSIFSIIANKKINSAIKLAIIRDNTTIQIPFTTQIRPQQTMLKDIQDSLWPGYITEPLLYYEKQEYGLEDTAFALYVSDVYELTSAKEAGLELHDIILDINNQNIQNYNKYFQIINDALLEGNEVHLKVLRNGSNIEHILFLPPIIKNKDKSIPTPLT